MHRQCSICLLEAVRPQLNGAPPLAIVDHERGGLSGDQGGDAPVSWRGHLKRRPGRPGGDLEVLKVARRWPGGPGRRRAGGPGHNGAAPHRRCIRPSGAGRERTAVCHSIGHRTLRGPHNSRGATTGALRAPTCRPISVVGFIFFARPRT